MPSHVKRFYPGPPLSKALLLLLFPAALCRCFSEQRNSIAMVRDSEQCRRNAVHNSAVQSFTSAPTCFAVAAPLRSNAGQTKPLRRHAEHFRCRASQGQSAAVRCEAFPLLGMALAILSLPLRGKVRISRPGAPSTQNGPCRSCATGRCRGACHNRATL